MTNQARTTPTHITHELAGHGSIETTRRYYMAITDEDMALARKAAEEALQGEA